MCVVLLARALTASRRRLLRLRGTHWMPHAISLPSRPRFGRERETGAGVEAWRSFWAALARARPRARLPTSAPQAAAVTPGGARATPASRPRRERHCALQERRARTRRLSLSTLTSLFPQLHLRRDARPPLRPRPGRPGRRPGRQARLSDRRLRPRPHRLPLLRPRRRLHARPAGRQARAPPARVLHPPLPPGRLGESAGRHRARRHRGRDSTSLTARRRRQPGRPGREDARPDLPALCAGPPGGGL